HTEPGRLHGGRPIGETTTEPADTAQPCPARRGGSERPILTIAPDLMKWLHRPEEAAQAASEGHAGKTGN
ncbi:hypothetical protein ACN3XK_74260, partial [Actinomadura welshii]